MGTHVHRLDPVRAGKCVWHVGCQDVMAIGTLFTTGRLRTERIVALGGPRVLRPRLVRTRVGASIEDLLRGEVAAGACRTVSGSVLSGDEVAGATAFLGRHHAQIAVLGPSPYGSGAGVRPVMLPLPVYRRVFALGTPIVPLLRALLAGDVERAEALGALELVEEDLALCSYVCPGRIAYGPPLRLVLDALETGK